MLVCCVSAGLPELIASSMVAQHCVNGDTMGQYEMANI